MVKEVFVGPLNIQHINEKWFQKMSNTICESFSLNLLESQALDKAFAIQLDESFCTKAASFARIVKKDFYEDLWNFSNEDNLLLETPSDMQTEINPLMKEEPLPLNVNKNIINNNALSLHKSIGAAEITQNNQCN